MYTHPQFRKLVLFLKGMGNGRRIAMLKEMLKGPCTNVELVERLDIPETTVSRNLMILQKGGVIEGKRIKNAVLFVVTDVELVTTILNHRLFE